MSHVKAGGTAKNVHNNAGQRLGVKRFGGQKVIENTIQKVQRLRELIDKSGSKALIEIDGGVQNETAPRLVQAGADVLVAGSYVFGSKNPEQVIHDLRSL